MTNLFGLCQSITDTIPSESTADISPNSRESKGSGSVIFILVNDPMFVFNNKTNMFWAALQGISESRLNQYITIMIYMSHYSFTLMALLIIYWINACPNEEQGISNATLCIQTFEHLQRQANLL